MSILQNLKSKFPQTRLITPKQVDTIDKLITGNPALSYNSGIWNYNCTSQISSLRDIPNMIKDGIVGSCLNLIMDYCFKPNNKGQVMWVESDYDVIVPRTE